MADRRYITGQSCAVQGVDHINATKIVTTVVTIQRQLPMPRGTYAVITASGLWTSSVAGDRIALSIQDGSGNIITHGEMIDVCVTRNHHQIWNMQAIVPRNLAGDSPATLQPAVQFCRYAGRGKVTVCRSQILIQTFGA